MILIFFVEFISYFNFALRAEDIIGWFLYILCLWINGYYFWKFLYEKRKEYKLSYAFLSNIMFTFIIICRLMSLFASNLWCHVSLLLGCHNHNFRPELYTLMVEDFLQFLHVYNYLVFSNLLVLCKKDHLKI